MQNIKPFIRKKRQYISVASNFGMAYAALPGSTGMSRTYRLGLTIVRGAKSFVMPQRPALGFLCEVVNRHLRSSCHNVKIAKKRRRPLLNWDAPVCNVHTHTVDLAQRYLKWIVSANPIFSQFLNKAVDIVCGLTQKCAGIF
jgi:hypothetical protein